MSKLTGLLALVAVIALAFALGAVAARNRSPLDVPLRRALVEKPYDTQQQTVNGNVVVTCSVWTNQPDVLMGAPPTNGWKFAQSCVAVKKKRPKA